MLPCLTPEGPTVAGTRKIAAILVADIVGYGRLAGADEDRTLARLRGLRSDLIDPAIDAHHGRIVKRTGDGSLVEFRSVVDAVRCAIEVQNGLVERNAGLTPERRIEFRVGIHLGDVVEEADGDLMGDGVNIAARLEGIAAPGAICLSEDAYRQVSGRLDMEVTDLGPTKLKNIEKPIRVYSLEVSKASQAKPIKPGLLKGPLGVLAAGSMALIVIAASAAYFLGANRTATVVPTAAGPAEPARLSIVVLPFTNLSNDPNQDYFADGITENLTTDLSPASAYLRDRPQYRLRLQGQERRRQRDRQRARRALSTTEGSVQRDQNRVHVNAQLIVRRLRRASLRPTASREDVANLFKLQDEVVARLANSLEL